MSKVCLFVLGMHRSGTSAMAGALSFLNLGFDSHLVKAVPNDNPKGYWEPVEVVKINDDIFAAVNMHYMDFDSFPSDWMNIKDMEQIRKRINDWINQSFSEKSLIVVKDPRLCRTLPLWVDELEKLQVKAKYIHVFRHPMEVVNSLRVRDETFPVVEGLLAWLAHVLDAFKSTDQKDSAIVSYSRLLDTPVLALEAIGRNLHLEWPVNPEKVAEKLRIFLEPSLMHQHFTGEIPYPPLSKLTESVNDCLQSYDLNAFDAAFSSYINDCHGELNEYRNLFESILLRRSLMLEAEKKNIAEQIQYRDDLVKALGEQLEIEKNNAAEQVAYRDALLAEVREQLQAEQENAAEQVAYRDALLAEVREQLQAEQENAAEQVAYRDALLAEVRGRLSDEKANAVEQIEYRNALLAEQGKELEFRNELLSSRKALLKLLINPFDREKV